MKSYHISELEQLSGIKAHTIRVWERRYNLIEPDRTETNIRMYDDDQVRKLLNVSTLLANGYKISKIASLNKEDIIKKINEIQSGKESTDVIATSYINDFAASMIDFDELAFEKTFSAVVTRYGMFDAMIRVFYPLMQKIGFMWATGEAMPVQEHFASVIVRKKLIAAIDGQLPPVKKNKKFLLMLPPNEWHEIGLLFSEYILRSKGIQTLYLGANVPYENIKAVFTKTKITHLLTFVIARRTDEDLSLIRKNLGIPNEVELLVAGNPEITQLISKQKNTKILQSPVDLLTFI